MAVAQLDCTVTLSGPVSRTVTPGSSTTCQFAVDPTSGIAQVSGLGRSSLNGHVGACRGENQVDQKLITNPIAKHL
jgi:hypothetical protein